MTGMTDFISQWKFLGHVC